MKESDLQNRAFDCAEKNDIDGFLQCCDEGFDVNRPKNMEINLLDDRYSVSFLALRNALYLDNWSLLKSLLERYDADSLLVISSQQKTQRTLRSCTDFIMEYEWPDLVHDTFESSNAHFCLWRICHPFSSTLLYSAAQKEEIGIFFQNCKALEQKNKLNSSVGELKDQKPAKQKQSRM